MRSSVIINAFIAVLVGFGGSVAVVIAATQAVSATQAQTASWIAMLCASMMVTTAVLSIRHRMPIVTAWSTPGAALIAATSGVTIEQAVGAFMVAGGLIVASGLVGPLGRAIARIPASVASAMLAGVIFSFVVAILGQIEAAPALTLPLLAVFLVVRLFSPAYAVLAVLALGIVLAYALGLTEPAGGFQLSALVWITPHFDAATMIGLALPLYLVTMVSQNLPGFAVLSAAGYPPPVRSSLTVTGLASVLTAPFGAHTTSMAAITASICTGEDTHPDPTRRWLCGPFYALGYGVLALFGASVVALFSSFPQALIVVVAGVALTGPFIGALANALAGKSGQAAAAITFVITASGFSIYGIGAPFWGLVGGLAVVALDGLYAGLRSPAPEPD